jgi:ABC-type branched-subunit amino acid transport system ATPase component
MCAGIFYTQQTTERFNRTTVTKNVLFAQQVYAKQANKLEGFLFCHDKEIILLSIHVSRLKF